MAGALRSSGLRFLKMTTFSKGNKYLSRLMLLLRLLMLYQGAASHFTLDMPRSIGFIEDSETSAPCGGPDPTTLSANSVTFGANGDLVYVNMQHPQANWLFRLITMDGFKSNGTWLQLYPIVEQTGLGRLCLRLSVPQAWIGSTAVFGAVADAPDGVLYQVNIAPSSLPAYGSL